MTSDAQPPVPAHNYGVVREGFDKGYLLFFSVAYSLMFGFLKMMSRSIPVVAGNSLFKPRDFIVVITVVGAFFLVYALQYPFTEFRKALKTAERDYAQNGLRAWIEAEFGYHISVSQAHMLYDGATVLGRKKTSGGVDMVCLSIGNLTGFKASVKDDSYCGNRRITMNLTNQHVAVLT